MKKIVLDKNETIGVNNVEKNAKVGIQWSGGKKSFIIQTIGGFYGLDESLDTLNSWCDETMQGYIERALNQEGSQAFYFYEASELFQWMSE